MMKIKSVIKFVLIIYIFYANYNIYTYYNDNLNIKNLIEKKLKIKNLVERYNSNKIYRCYDYYDIDIYNKYTEKKCIQFIYNYLNYKLTLSKFIFMFYVKNTCYIVLYIIISIAI